MDILNMLPRRFYEIDGVEYLVTNITANVNISSSTKITKSLFLDYEIIGEETPRDIAGRLYENRDLYWTILVVNDMVNIVEDWPKPYNKLYEIASREFFEGELEEVVAYADTEGNQVDLVGLRFTNGHSDTVPSDQELIGIYSLTPVTRFDLFEMQNEMKRKIKLVDPDLIDDFVSAFRVALK